MGITTAICLLFALWLVQGAVAFSLAPTKAKHPVAALRLAAREGGHAVTSVEGVVAFSLAPTKAKRPVAALRLGAREGESAVSPKELFAQSKIKYTLDQMFVAAVGGCLFWGFGTFVDFYSYGLGALFGICYFILLGKYVDSIGATEYTPGMGGGSARFGVIILLVLLYGKYKTMLHFIPALTGFFTYLVATFAQAFDPTPADEVGGQLFPDKRES